MKVCELTEEEISQHLGTVFAALVMLIKSGKLDQTSDMPVRSTDGLYHGKPLHVFPFLQKEDQP